MMKFNDSGSEAAGAEASGAEPSVPDLVRGLPGWYLADRRRTLGVKYRFHETPQALDFLARVTELAREHDATPHLVLTAGGQLHLRLRSHQPGGVGGEELAFARAVATLYQGNAAGVGRSGFAA